MDLLAHEPWVRLGSFACVLGTMLAWEALAPRRPPHEARPRHAGRNLTITVLDAVVVRLAVPLLPVGLATLAAARGWGALNLTAWPAWIEIALAIVVLDGVIYMQHVMFHAVPVLWRLHMVHHTDLDFDTTTGVRFHPFEILLSLGVKAAAVLVLGPAPVAVLLFEILLNATALFNHGNVSLPLMLDRLLRTFLVTPDMHRVHHSTFVDETNSNFGFNLSIWDRLFGTYVPQPRKGHLNMNIGLESYRDVRKLRLGRLLLLPFIARAGRYNIRGRSGNHLPPAA